MAQAYNPYDPQEQVRKKLLAQMQPGEVPAVPGQGATPTQIPTANVTPAGTTFKPLPVPKLPATDPGQSGVQPVSPTEAGPKTTLPVPATGPGQYRNQLAGFDFGKLDAGKVDPKYIFAKYAQQYNIQDPAQREAMIQALRADPSGFFGDASLDGDTLNFSITDPSFFSGRTGKLGVDVIQNFRWADPSQMRAQWLDPIGEAGGAAAPNPATAPGMSGISGGAGQGSAQGGSEAGGGYGDQVRAKLLELMNQGPVGITDPIIKAQADAYAQAQQRGLENTRAALAERAGTQGTLGSGGYTADVQGATDDTWSNIAGKNAELVGSGNEQRRAEIMQALSLGTNYLTAEEQRALQAELYKLGLGWDMSKYQYEASQDPFKGIF